ncbi:MAG: PLP-dependent transferase [Oscillospiraceae bacterium]
MEKQTLGFDTLQVHAGQHPDSETQSRCVPIYQTAAYSFSDAADARELFALEKTGNIYSRLTNPTNDVLEKRMAALDGGVGALAMASGHAAIFNAILNLAGAGDEIVSSICIYGGAVNLLGVTLGRIGIQTKFVDPDDLRVGGCVTEACILWWWEARECCHEKIVRCASSAIIGSTVTTPIQSTVCWRGHPVYSAASFRRARHEHRRHWVDSGNFSF